MNIKKLSIFGIFLLVISLAYINTLKFSFVSDDIPYILDSSLIREFGFSCSDISSVFLPGKDQVGTDLAGYIPLTTLTLGIDCILYGTKPAGYHLTNILIYILCVFLSYIFIQKFIQSKRAAFVGALLFAVLPIHSEAVAWIMARGFILGAAFSFAAILLHIRNRAAGTLILFISAAMSHPSYLILPFIFILYDMHFNKKKEISSNSRIRYYVYFASMALAYLYLSQSSHGIYETAPLKLFISRIIYSTSMIFLPFRYFNSSFNYYHHFLPLFNRFAPLLILFFTGIIILALYFYKKGLRTASFGILWSIIWTIPFPGQSHYARYFFMASFGPCILLSVIFNKIYAITRIRKIVWAVFVIIILILTGITCRNNIHLSNPYSFSRYEY